MIKDSSGVEKIMIIVVTLSIIGAVVLMIIFGLETVRKKEKIEIAFEEYKERINNCIKILDTYLEKIDNLKETGFHTPRYALGPLLVEITKIDSEISNLELPCEELINLHLWCKMYSKNVINGFKKFISASSFFNDLENRKLEKESITSFITAELMREIYIDLRGKIRKYLDDIKIEDFYGSSSKQMIEKIKEDIKNIPTLSDNNTNEQIYIRIYNNMESS